MAQSTWVEWDQLSPGVRDTLSWARAVEVDARGAGTRGLLIGMLRSREDPASALLSWFDVSEEQLLMALQRQVPEKKLDPAVRPAALDALPELTDNALWCLERAAALQEEVSSANLDVACLLTALLENRSATANAALAEVIAGAEIDAIADGTSKWLHDRRSTYLEALARMFPRPPPPPEPRSRPATKRATRDAPASSGSVAIAPASDPSDASDTGNASDASDVDPDDRRIGSWPPFVMAVSTDQGSGEVGEQHVIGLGVLVSPTQLGVPGISPAKWAHGHTGDAQEIEPLQTPVRWTHAVCIVTPPPPDEIAIAPPSALPEAGARCWIVSVGLTSVDQPIEPRVHLGRIALIGDGPDDPTSRSISDFYVELDSPIEDGRGTWGSPVLSGGKLVGTVDRDGSGLARFTVGDRTAGVVIAVATRDLDRMTVATGTVMGAGNDAVFDNDQLGFQHYVDAFAELITSRDTKPPLTIGIFGSWGMGKSFLLRNIENTIKDARKPGDLVVHVVSFNAWEYSATDVIWPGLVRKVVNTLDRDVPWPWYKRRWTRLKRNLPRRVHRLGSQIAAALIVTAAAIAVAWIDGRTGLAATIGVVAAAFGVGGFLKAAQDPVARWITGLFADSDYGRQLGVMEDIKEDLTALEARLREKGKAYGPATGRVLILIDDLDRCEPDKAVEVLQAVNLLLNFPGFIVCMGIDARIVTGAIEKHYEGLLGPAGASGYEYLDKIVQIPFRIPEPTPVDVMRLLTDQLGSPKRPGRAIADALGDPDAQTAADGSSRPEPPQSAPVAGGMGAPADPVAVPLRARPPATPPTPPRSSSAGTARVPDRPVPPIPGPVSFTYAELEAFELFARYLRPNPRHLKRLVNVYRLVRALARARGEQLILEQPAATIRWLVMWSQWPYASLKMIDRLDELRATGGGRMPASVSEGDPLLHLLAYVEPRLDDVTRGQLDDDPSDLRQLLSIKGYGLSWDEIESIRHYTVNFNPAVEERVRDERTPATPAAGVGAAPLTG